MATRSVTRLDVPGGVLYTWTGLLNGDVGEAIEAHEMGDRTVTFDGPTFGTGGMIKLRGSNDGANYYDMTDPQGNAISKTAAGVEIVAERPRYMRPEVTAGDGTTSLTCRLFCVRSVWRS